MKLRWILGICLAMLLATSCNWSDDNGVAEAETSDSPKNQIEIDLERVESYLKEKGIEATKHKSGIYYVIKEKGTGVAISAQSIVTIDTKGSLFNGIEFYSTYKEQQPMTIMMGEGMTISGLEKGLQLLSEGDKATFFIPANLAYGEQGDGDIIPPNVALIWEVDVISVQ